jgi:hypothetical protein
LSGGDHRWFRRRRSAREKRPVTKANIIIIIIITTTTAMRLDLLVLLYMTIQRSVNLNTCNIVGKFLGYSATWPSAMRALNLHFRY